MALVCGHCGGSWWGGGGHCTNNTRPGTPCNLHNQLQVKFTWFYSTSITVLAKKNRSALFFHFYVLFFGPSEWIRN
jgi:hypothetical protein